MLGFVYCKSSFGFILKNFFLNCPSVCNHDTMMTKRKGWLCFGGQLTTFLSRLNSSLKPHYFLSKCNFFFVNLITKKLVMHQLQLVKSNFEVLRTEIPFLFQKTFTEFFFVLIQFAYFVFVKHIAMKYVFFKNDNFLLLLT